MTEGVVWRWRKALGVTKLNNSRTRELVCQSARKGARAAGEEAKTHRARRRKRKIALELNLIRHAHTYNAVRPDAWTDEELALLGTIPDAEVARRTGRTHTAVRLKRLRLGIPNPHDGRRR